MTGKEKLAAYLKRRKLTQRVFAEQAKVPVPQVSMWLSGRRRPGLASAVAIEQATRGSVRAEDWI